MLVLALLRWNVNVSELLDLLRHELTHTCGSVQPLKACSLIQVLSVALAALRWFDRAVKRLQQPVRVHERTIALRERARGQIPPDAFVLLTIGRRVRAKGHLRVIAALAALPAELRQRCCYLVVGDGPDTYARELDDAATQAGVRLVLAGRLDDANTIAAADASNLFIMPSLETPRRLEGFGIAYVEAAARGLPSVAVATGGVAEAVRDGETGIVLPPDAPHAAIADAISRFASDPAMTAAMSQAGNQWANEFMWRRHAEQVNARMANTGR